MYELLLQWVGVIHDVFVFGVNFIKRDMQKKKKKKKKKKEKKNKKKIQKIMYVCVGL